MAVLAPFFRLKRAGLAAGAFLFLGGNLSLAESPLLTTFAGSAVVIDGDTLEIGGTHIRLEGIDAPESDQSCKDARGADWPCGRQASRYLSQLSAGADVACDSTGLDKYGRMLAICYANGVEMNAEMVRSGFARAFVKYSMLYVNDEQAASQAGIGIWQGAAETPWDYRHKRWQTADVPAPASCAVKGNISRKGLIYHGPWSPWYSNVIIDERRGERWFCSEADAEAAGWRAAHVN